MRDVDDDRLRQRASDLLPWLREVLGAFQAEETKPQPPATRPAPVERTLEEQIAAAVQAALKTQAAPTNPNGQRQPSPRDPMVAPTNDIDPSWCPIHRCKMERRSNERGTWYSHRLGSGAYCKGE
jgi:hypothetical protein